MEDKKKQVEKEFKLSSWAINNKTTIYVSMFLILYLGVTAYF
ncbi:MAG: multidrug efflux pump, partial [Polaribacter sp.]